MNRQKILITACVLASFSIGVNIWLLARKKDEPSPGPAAKAGTGLPTASDFSFEDTKFADGSWKLDVEKPRIPKMTPEGEPAGPGFEEVAPETNEGKEKPVFGGTALDDEGWKLGDGKKKEEPPATIGPPRSEPPPPAPAPPQVKSASRARVFQGADFGGTAFADEAWRLTDVSEDDEPAVAWETAFSFEEFSYRCPVNWEVEGFLDYRPRWIFAPGGGGREYFHRRIRTLTGSYELDYHGFRPRDTASVPAVNDGNQSEMNIH